MPEIQEETESTGKISPLKSSAAKTQRENEFISSSARSFELSNNNFPLTYNSPSQFHRYRRIESKVSSTTT